MIFKTILSVIIYKPNKSQHDQLSNYPFKIYIFNFMYPLSSTSREIKNKNKNYAYENKINKKSG